MISCNLIVIFPLKPGTNMFVEEQIVAGIALLHKFKGATWYTVTSKELYGAIRLIGEFSTFKDYEDTFNILNDIPDYEILD